MTVPGLYLALLIVSFVGIVLIDVRLRLVGPTAPWRTASAVAIGTVFFLLWDAAGIALGIFVKGDSPALIGIDLAPHLPLEEPIFLAFLCYLALVVWAGAERALTARAERRRTEESTSS